MQVISIRVPARPADVSVRARLWARIGRWASSAWCIVNGGHHKVLHTQPGRMSLKCVACGHDSPGWDVGGLRRVVGGPVIRKQIGQKRERTGPK